MKKTLTFKETLPLSSKTDWTFSGQNAFDYIYNLSEVIGSRFGGSDGEKTAADYIAGVFKSFGLRTFLQKYPIWTCDNTKAVCEISLDGKNFQEINFEPVLPSASTPKNGIEGEVFFALQGYAEAMTPDVKGKIVLLSQGIPKEERKRFLSYKPLAVVMADNNYEGYLHRQHYGKIFFANWGDITTAVITYLDALKLYENGYAKMRLKMQNSAEYVWSHNVIGEIKGTEMPEEITVICGHYDTHWRCPGATDNAGGTSIVMELARILSSKKPRRTLRFVLFGGEESGLNGSIAYAHALYEDDEKQRAKKSFNHMSGRTLLHDHRLCFNIDVMGALIAENVMLYSGSEDLGASMRLLMKEMNLRCHSKAEPMSSDGTPLAAVGIPTLQYGRYGAPTRHGHSGNDKIKYLSPKAMQISGDLCLTWLKRYIIDMCVFPFAREVPKEHIDACDRYFQGRRGRNPRFTTNELFPDGVPKGKDSSKENVF